jgi:hypothetical protein
MFWSVAKATGPITSRSCRSARPCRARARYDGKVVRRSGRYIAEDKLLGGEAAERSRDIIEEFLARLHLRILERQLERVAGSAAAAEMMEILCTGSAFGSTEETSAWPAS